MSVLVLGGILVWVIIDRLPEWMGTTRNQHSFIDQLEQSGMIDFTGKNLSGESVTLSQYKGKIIILSFWASWCAPCIEEFPSMISLLKQFPDQVVMLAVSADYSKEDIEIFLKSIKVDSSISNLQIIWDPESEISKKYQIQKLPESFIFYKEGKLLRKVVGSIKWDDADAINFFKTNLK